MPPLLVTERGKSVGPLPGTSVTGGGDGTVRLGGAGGGEVGDGVGAGGVEGAGVVGAGLDGVVG
ncbi:hypothetical protein DMH04_39495, partial [Kibdelosporangium aridum]